MLRKPLVFEIWQPKDHHSSHESRPKSMDADFILRFLENKASERKKCHGWPPSKLNFTSDKPVAQCQESFSQEIRPKNPSFPHKISRKTRQRLPWVSSESLARIACKTDGPPLLQTLPIIIRGCEPCEPRIIKKTSGDLWAVISRKPKVSEAWSPRHFLLQIGWPFEPSSRWAGFPSKKLRLATTFWRKMIFEVMWHACQM